jgi:hypothetical protein
MKVSGDVVAWAWPDIGMLEIPTSPAKNVGTDVE